MVLQHLPEMRNVLVATMRLLLLYISRAICTLTFCSEAMPSCVHVTGCSRCQADAVMRNFCTALEFTGRS